MLTKSNYKDLKCIMRQLGVLTPNQVGRGDGGGMDLTQFPGFVLPFHSITMDIMEKSRSRKGHPTQIVRLLYLFAVNEATRSRNCVGYKLARVVEGSTLHDCRVSHYRFIIMLSFTAWKRPMLWIELTL